MSHVFISYSHQNKKHLKKLLTALKKAGFQEDEIWYDKHNRAGEDWRDDIEAALKESYAVIVIITSASMLSTYVTYEWSWALGHGLRVLPALFEDISDNHIHARLSKIHRINCIQAVDTLVSKQLLEWRQKSPLEAYLGRSIGSIIYRFRIISLFALWLHQYLDLNVISYREFHFFIVSLCKETLKVFNEELPAFWRDNASAFSLKTEKIYNELLVEMGRFWDSGDGHGLHELLMFGENGLTDRKTLIMWLYNHNHQVLETLFSKLDAVDSHFNYLPFKAYLAGASNNSNSQSSLDAIHNFFSIGITALNNVDEINLAKDIIDRVKKLHDENTE